MGEIVIADLPPETLIEMANESAELAEQNLREAVQHALRAGRALAAAKAQLPHGKWMAWLRTNFDRDIGTAARYMRLADNWHSTPNIQQSESIRQALRLIAEDGRQAELIEVQPERRAPELDAEPRAPEPDEPDDTDEPEIESQERPSIRKVSVEARKVSEDKRPKTPEAAAHDSWPDSVDEPGEMVLWYRVGESFAVADADDVAAAALQLHEPLAIVRMAVLAVAPKDMPYALDELQQACKWLEQMIEEGGEYGPL
jgi:hypothetical protein